MYRSWVLKLSSWTFEIWQKLFRENKKILLNLARGFWTIGRHRWTSVNMCIQLYQYRCSVSLRTRESPVDEHYFLISISKPSNYLWRNSQKKEIPSQMTEKHVQWLTYHFNIEYMFHVALEQLHHVDDNNDDEIYFVNKYIFILNLS